MGRLAGPSDFRAHLRRQLGFLSRSIEAFDAGFRDEAIRMAVVIRTLVHDTERSTSLLTYLGVKDTARLISTAPAPPPDDAVLFQLGMGFMKFGDDGLALYPSLGEFDRWWPVPIADWWGEVIHVFDGGKTRITRATMTLLAANKEGGAHVDPKLTGAFKRLAQDGVLHVARGFGEDKVSTPLLDFHYPSLREMAFEITHSPDILAMASDVFPGSCDACGGAERGDAREPRLARRNLVSATQCHELECGHRWHVTASLEDGIKSPVVYPHVCDCSLGEYDSRAFRLVGKRHHGFSAYAWQQYEAEGRGAIVVWEADARKKPGIPDDVQVDPVYKVGYCTLEGLQGADAPVWLRNHADRVVPAVSEYDPQKGYIVFCHHLDAGVPPTVLRMEGVPPTPPDAYAALDPLDRDPFA